MSDFEEQVGATLAVVAEDAPDASRLAAGARRRHRVRRQRRIAVGGAAAALVVAVSAVALGTRGGDNSIAEDPTETPSGAWQTISQGDLRASLPPDWKAYDCGDDAVPTAHAAPGQDPCADGNGTYFEDRQTYEPLDAPGVVVRRPGDGRAYWTAFVYIHEWAFNVTTTDRDLTRQVLATARLEGQPVIDASQWVSFERNGIGYDIPAFWGVGEKGDRSGYSVCAVPSSQRDGVGEQLDDRRYRYNRAFGDHQVTLIAPTSAVADIVWASLNEAPDAVDGGCAEEDFNVGLLPPEGGSGGLVEGSESAPGAMTVAEAAVALGADLERFHETEGEYPIDGDTVANLIEDGDLSPLQPGHQLTTYFELTVREPGVLFCLVNETTGEYAAYDSTAGGLIGQGTGEPGDATALNDACVGVINNG